MSMPSPHMTPIFPDHIGTTCPAFVIASTTSPYGVAIIIVSSGSLRDAFSIKRRLLLYRVNMPGHGVYACHRR